jgi:GT2 family glycosyltransferase
MVGDAREPTTCSVLIATLGRPDVLGRALASIADGASAPVEVIVVDGDAARGAESAARTAATSAPCPVRYVPCSPGLTHQRNVALAEASGDVVLFIDDDARLAPDALTRLLAAYDDPAVVGATGKVVEPASNKRGGKTSRWRRLLPGGGTDGTFTRFGYPRRLVDEDVERDVEFMAGCFMSARTSAARKVGFDEKLPGYALAEDEDFSYRLSQLGRIRYLPDALVLHDNAGFGGRDTRAFGRQVVRNRSYLFRKNFPQTPLARLQFTLLLALLVGHRLANADARGAFGIVEGAVERLRGKGLTDRELGSA